MISGDGLHKNIVTYSQLLDKLEDENGTDDEWQFRSIDDHEGPLKQSNPNYNGSQWNVKITWEDGSTTWEPLSIIAKSDPAVTCAIYGDENDLLALDGWKRFA